MLTRYMDGRTDEQGDSYISSQTLFVGGITSGTGTSYPFGALEFTPALSGVRIAQSLGFYEPLFVFCHIWPIVLSYPFSTLYVQTFPILSGSIVNITCLISCCSEGSI